MDEPLVGQSEVVLSLRSQCQVALLSLVEPGVGMFRGAADVLNALACSMEPGRYLEVRQFILSVTGSYREKRYRRCGPSAHESKPSLVGAQLERSRV